MAQPEITIGLPVYNAEDRIGPCLDSLTGQDFESLRIVVSDNASTDDTVAIIRDRMARDSRIMLLQQPSNIGMVGNFLRVALEATSPFFLWRADDDEMGPSYVTSLHEALREQESCYLSVPNIRVDRESDGTQFHKPVPECVLDVVPHGPERILTLLGELHPSWFYGLWRTPVIQRHYATVARLYGQVHAHDLLVLLAPVLDNAIIGAPDVTFIQNVDSRGRKHRTGAAGFGARIAMREQSWLPFVASVEALLDAREVSTDTRARLQAPLRAFAEKHVGCNQRKFIWWQLRKMLLP